MAIESKIEKKACEWAERNGWLVRKLKTPQNRGAPDRMFLKHGWVLFIEFKDPDEGELSALQIEEHRKYRLRGHFVHVFDSVKDAIVALQDRA